MAGDPLITHTMDRTVAERLMIDQHWVNDQGVHYVVTSVRQLADPFGKSMWPFHGRLECAEDDCPIRGRSGGLRSRSGLLCLVMALVGAIAWFGLGVLRRHQRRAEQGR
jgi:hypothetical protein